MTDQTPAILTIDIGGSKYMPGIVDFEGNVLCCERREWEDVSPEGIVSQLVDACADVMADHPEEAARVVVGGITIPAFADPVEGIWIDSDYLDVHDLPICQLLGEALDVPFFGDNDCNACVLAESYFGGARGERDFLYMTVSSGVGGGVFLDGELFYGARYLSGEMGLTICTPGGRPSLSGNELGPLEMYASGPALAQNYAELGGPAEVDGRPVGGREIAEAADRGEGPALAALELEGRYLGRAIANACSVLDPAVVILGGGISLLFDRYRGPLMAELERLRPGCRTQVRATGLGYEGAFLGAAACGLRGYRGFAKALGAGDDGSCELVVEHADGRFAARLVADGREVLTGPSVGGLGTFLVAGGMDDPGRTLDEIWADATLAAEDRHDALGRAIAFFCMVLDPGTIRVRGVSGEAAPVVRAALVRETFYHDDSLPYRIVWESQ